VDDRRLSVKWRTYPADVLPAWVAEMDFPLAEPIKAALHEAIDHDDTGYLGPDLCGVPEAFAAFAKRRLGWDVDPAHVRGAADVMTGVEELLQALTDPGAGVIITPPVYQPFFDDIRHAGRRVVEAPLVSTGFDIGAIERALAAGAQALLLSNPHNPLGRVWSAGELATVADLAAEHGAWLISDEIHGPLARAYTPIATISERAVALSSASKAFNLAGLKLGLIVGPPDVLDRLYHDMPARAGLFGAIAARAAFEAGDEWLDAVLTTIEGNRRLLGELLARELPDVGYTPPEASYLAWLNCRGLGLGDDPAAVFLEHGRVALTPGPGFGTGGLGFARLNIGTTPERVEAAVSRMAAALKR
jgi:cystathionine beta-lyase